MPPDAEGGRADKVLARLLPGLEGYRLREAFARSDVKRGGVRIRPDTPLAPGDAIVLYTDDPAQPALDIVHQDDEYAIVNKRQGMPTQGAGSVEEVYRAQAGAPAFACHRLDVQTGGLLLLARTPEALARAEAAFAAHSLRKTYHALVRGVPDPAEAALHAYLRKDATAARVTVHDRPLPGALPIETRYRVLRVREDGNALLVIDLITGRTHQIRAHLAHIGHPVLGDDRYGDRALNRLLGLRRQQLWATGLTLWDGRAFAVDAPFT